MGLNGLNAPDETTLVPLNAVDTDPIEQNKEPIQPGYCFYCGRYGNYKAQYRKLTKDRYFEYRV